jgi:4-amino-4-deoxychorismate mutase
MTTLSDYRVEIDSIDAEIVRCFAKRIRLCEKVALFKKENSISVMQPERVAVVLSRTASLAVEAGINPSMLTSIYRLLIEETCRIEAQIIEDSRVNETVGDR